MKQHALQVPIVSAMTTLLAAAAHGITYVDATDGPDGNTIMAATPDGPVHAGAAWTVTDADRPDHTWRKRTGYGLPPTVTSIATGSPLPTFDVAAGTIYESTGPGEDVDDVPRLKTTVSGLPADTYTVYVYFWSDQTASPWQIRAGLEDAADALPLYVGGNTPTGEPAPVLIGRDAMGRKLFRVELGQTTGTSISVFVEDGPGSDGNRRTWYDGIGYAAASGAATMTESPSTSDALPLVEPPFPSAAVPQPRGDANSRIAHEQLVEKAKAGGIDLYFLGDSITRRWGTSDAIWAENLENWRQNFFGWNAGNFGWGADGIQHMLWRIRNGELDGVNPRVIVISGGTNNIGATPRSQAFVDDLLAGFDALIATCREKAPAATIILTAIFPRNDNPAVWPTIRAVNRGLAERADGETIFYLNINDQLADEDGTLHDGMTIDKLHLSVKAYQLWADALRPLLTELLGPRADTDHAPPPTGDPSASVSPGS